MAEQLGTFASAMAAPPPPGQVSRENMKKMMQYAGGKRLFTAGEIQMDVGLSKDSPYAALKAT